MQNIFDILGQSPLFYGISPESCESMLRCLAARTESYAKDDVILLSGDSVREVGLLLSGSAKIIREDVNGNISIIAGVLPAEMFGEAFACAGVAHSPVTVVAAELCRVLFLDYRRIITTCSAACVFHARLIENMLKVIADKNLRLNQKIEVLSQRTTRQKLMAYFERQGAGAPKFTIPFNREELAQYLCVDRSAMSAELGRMQREGLIRFTRNEFEILSM